MIKQPLIRAMTVAGFSTCMLISAAANAQFTVDNMPAIKSGFPLDMAQWVSDPDKYSWNPANIRRGTHPDRPDGVVYIFKNKTDADAWWNPVTNPTDMPSTIPDTAVAYMHWALDNESGLFPGVMAITDDLDFQNSNCIMSSGLLIVDEGVPTKKTCGNPPASAKRFKLVILQADLPIDLIFNMETKGLTYYNYDDPAPDSSLDVTGDIFRNYRYLMKVGNGTATDTVGGARTGTRLSGIKVELGFSNLTTGVFTPVANQDTAPDGIIYETRRCIDKRYWDIADDHELGLDECPAQVREVFLEEEFATFSPGMYAPVGDARNPDGGYWDTEPAGMVPPPLSLQQPQFIDSGDKVGNLGQTGAITDNYFDIAATQAAGSSTPISGNIFGYLMPYGVFADGDPGAISMGIYKDDDGNPATEGELHAWWDGSSVDCCYRWGIHGGPSGEAAWSMVSDADLAEMMARPLSETEVLDPPRYEVAYMDDLGGLNVDTFIKLTEAYNVGANPTFTVRLTARSIAAVTPGTEDGPWVANPADETAFEPDVPVEPVTPVTDGGSSGGFSLSWITAGLLALGLLLRRKRF